MGYAALTRGEWDGKFPPGEKLADLRDLKVRMEQSGMDRAAVYDMLLGTRGVPGIVSEHLEFWVGQGRSAEDAVDLLRAELGLIGIFDSDLDLVGLRRAAYAAFARTRNLGVGLETDPEEHLQATKARLRSERDTPPVRFGIPALDSATKGIFPGELLSVVAPQGSGKTALALTLAETALADGLKTLFVSADMGTQGLTIRRLMRRLRWPEWRVRQTVQGFRESDEPDLKRAAREQKESDAERFRLLGPDPGGWCTDDRVLAVAMRESPDVLVVDYLTLLKKPTDRSDLDTVNRTLPRLLSAADRLGFVLVVLSQMGRSAKVDQRSGASGGHAKGGGLTEERATAEVELIAHKDGDRTDFFASITKNRRGPCPAFRLTMKLPEIAFGREAVPVVRNTQRKAPYSAEALA
jgi:replicative DNA helicase